MNTAKRIMVIDDDASILEAVEILLQLEGYEVYTSMNGTQALQKIPEVQPQIILLDVLLSGEDGRDIARKLKLDETTKTIPIIMFSANPNIEKSTQEAGACAFLSKPFNVEDLIGLTNQYVH